MAQHLNNHHGESSNRPPNQMSTCNRQYKDFVGRSKKIIKKFYGKKRRMFLKNIDTNKL